MPWEILTSNDGAYLINWDGVTRIMRSCVRAELMDTYSSVVDSEKHWIGPDLWTCEVDWDRVNVETTTQTEDRLRKFYAGAKDSMQSQLSELAGMMADAEDYRDKFQDKMADAQHRTMENIESSVHKGEIGVKVATVVRDASAEFIMVGATYLSGGAALVAIGGGSAMKGAFVYQDTGKTRDAVATFGTNLVMGVADLKVGGAIEKAFTSKIDRIGMTIVWAKGKSLLEIPKGLIEGKTLNEAAAAGGVKLGASTGVTAGVEELKSFLEVKEMKAWAIPVEVVLNMAQDKVGDYLAKSGEKKETKGPPEHQRPPHRNHHLLDAILYDESVIEQSAVRKIGSGPMG